MSATEIAGLVSRPGLLDADPGLLAGWTADDVPTSLANQAFVLHGATVVPNTGSDADAALLGVRQTTTLFVPLRGEWSVIQGADSPSGGSHRGYASFCLDISDPPGAAPQGQPVVAAADGTVVFVRDTSPESQPNQQVPERIMRSPENPNDNRCAYEPNEVLIRHADDEYSSYLHLQPGSVPASVKQRLASGGMVQAGEQIGTVGRSGTGGYHLHFAYLRTPQLPPDPGVNPGTDSPISPCGYRRAVQPYTEILTRPFQLAHYQLRQPDGSFTYVASGIPERGQVIRAAVDVILSASGRVAWLRVNDQGTGFGPPFDFLDAEVLFAVDQLPDLALGFHLRNGPDLNTNSAMLQLLRAGFRRDEPVTVDYQLAGLKIGAAIRIALTR